ncbi:protein-tyrosine phosphatase family protein [Thalassotalea montiporae]
MCNEAKISYIYLTKQLQYAEFEKPFWGHESSILNNQGAVAVHCKGGSGRTGLVIALLLLQLGYNKSEVVEMVQTIRPKALVNPSQKAFFERFQPII